MVEVKGLGGVPQAALSKVRSLNKIDLKNSPNLFFGLKVVFKQFSERKAH
jgi:hypothetical protein